MPSYRNERPHRGLLVTIRPTEGGSEGDIRVPLATQVSWDTLQGLEMVRKPYM